MASGALFSMEDLVVEFDTEGGLVQAVNGVSYNVEAGEVVAIVGESGCGKSVSAMAVLGLLPSPPAKVPRGEIRFEGQNLLDVSEEEMSEVRGGRIGMIFQEPMTSLNPVLSIGLLERAWMLLGIERGTVEGSCSFDSGLPAWFALDQWFPAIFKVWEACGYTPELLFGITMAESLVLLGAVALLVSITMTVASVAGARKALV